jgi:hypothetical protein
MNRVASIVVSSLLVGSVSVGCGGDGKGAPLVVPRLTAEEAVLQVSMKFESTREARRLLAPPSELAIHQRQERSLLALSKANPTETLVVTERFQYQNGKVLECKAEGVRPLQATYRFEKDQAVAKLVAQALVLDFRCTGGIPKELVPSVEASAIELVLRDESLVVVLPSTDQRRFLPVD